MSGKLIAAISWLWLVSTSLSAQTLSQLQQDYTASLSQRNYAQAGTVWRQIYRQNPRAAAQMELHLAVLTDPEAPSEGALDTLVFLYSTYRPADSDAELQWLAHRANLAQELPASHAPQKVRWTVEALENHPQGEFDHLVPSLADGFQQVYAQDQFTQRELLKWWFRLDRHLYQREVKGSTGFGRRSTFRARVLDILGGCDALSQLARTDSDTRILLYSLCPNTFDGALSPPQQLTHPGWAYRHLALQAYAEGQAGACRAHLGQAYDLETEPLLRADLAVQLAGIIAQGGNYREARNWLRKAQKDAPNWSLPFLELARLYVEGSRNCGLSGFDRKAVYWLALDEIQTIMDRQSNPDGAVRELYFSYQKQMPTAEEMRFQGLEIGDTWPLRCWMNSVTTARLP